MPQLPLDFEVFCARCGEGLCNNCTEGNTPRRNMPYIRIEPCKKCAIDFEDSGYEKGYKEAEKYYEGT